MVGDVLKWNNLLYNNAGYSIIGYAGGLTDPAGSDGTCGITNYENSSTITGSWSVQHPASVLKTGSHNIDPYHGYKDGNNYYSITDSGHISYH